MACQTFSGIPTLGCCGPPPHRDFIGLNLVFEFNVHSLPLYTVDDLNGFLASMKAYLDAIPNLYNFVVPFPSFPMTVNRLNGRSFSPISNEFGASSVDSYGGSVPGEAQISSSGIYLESDPQIPIRALQVCRVDIGLASPKIICVREGQGDGNLYPTQPTAGPTLLSCVSTQYGAGVIAIPTPGVALAQSGQDGHGFPLYATPTAHGNHAWVSDQTGQDPCCNPAP